MQTSVYPKVINAPVDGYLAIAKDGIELKARARVTVRTNLAGLVGGATDDTIIARVGEGIVSAMALLIHILLYLKTRIIYPSCTQ